MNFRELNTFSQRYYVKFSEFLEIIGKIETRYDLLNELERLSKIIKEQPKSQVYMSISDNALRQMAYRSFDNVKEYYKDESDTMLFRILYSMYECAYNIWEEPKMK